MSKYHFSLKTVKPEKCTTQNNCPYKEVSPHGTLRGIEEYSHNYHKNKNGLLATSTQNTKYPSTFKDVQRAKNLSGNVNKARAMSNSIKDPIKFERRYNAIVEIYGEDSDMAKAFMGTDDLKKELKPIKDTSKSEIKFTGKTLGRFMETSEKMDDMLSIEKEIIEKKHELNEAKEARKRGEISKGEEDNVQDQFNDLIDNYKEHRRELKDTVYKYLINKLTGGKI